MFIDKYLCRPSAAAKVQRRDGAVGGPARSTARVLARSTARGLAHSAARSQCVADLGSQGQS
jgi:hypothetical protein